jgi:formylglycine-generating enzyme required for sulfatase activity
MTIRIFISYSHEDKRYLGKSSLIGFLRGLEREDVEFWSDQAITVGNKWDDVIKGEIAKAQIALVLVSQAFLDSPYCRNVEIYQFIQASESRGLVIFPIMLSACEWQRHEWLKSRQFLPGGKTIEEDFKFAGKKKRLFLEIKQNLREQIEKLGHNAQSKQQQQKASTKDKSQSKDKDKTEMILIRASNFTMGEGERKRLVYVEDFYIDKYPVTNADYERFLESIPLEERPRPPRSWDDTYAKNKANHPVMGVPFSLARRYAEWAGKRLPLEMEWEKAARGVDGRKYPWGNKFDKSKCNTDESGINDTTPVNQYPDGASPYGVLDMAGNVWEWVTDWADDVRKTIKGGSYKHDKDFAVCSSSEGYNPNSGRPSSVGFRCARSLN